MSHAPTDSPEALARVVAMMIVSDATLDPREIEMLDSINAFERLGMSRAGFMRVAKNHCADLSRRMGDKPWLNLSDIGLIDQILDGVRDDGKRLLVARIAAAVITADGRVRDIERMVFDHMLCRWGLTRQNVSQAILREQAAMA